MGHIYVSKSPILVFRCTHITYLSNLNDSCAPYTNTVDSRNSDVGYSEQFNIVNFLNSSIGSLSFYTNKTSGTVNICYSEQFDITIFLEPMFDF